MTNCNYSYSISLAALLIGACGGAGGDGTDTSVDAGSSVTVDAALPDGATRTFTLTMNRIFNTPTGDVTVPYSVAELEELGLGVALPPDYATQLMPSALSDGVATFENLPSGTIYAHAGPTHVVTDQDTVDFSHFDLGRIDTVAPEITPTNLVFNVSGMDSWQVGDELQIYSAGSGTYNYQMQFGASAGVPVANDTQLNGFTYDITRTLEPFLIDGVAGDRAILSHLVRSTDATHTYLALKETFEPDSFVIDDGGTTTLNGAFTDLVQDQTLSFRWDRALFDTALRAEAPGEVQALPYQVAHALPGGSTRGTYHSSTDLLIFSPGSTSDTSEVVADWPYADPHPLGWTRMLTTALHTYRQVSVASALPRRIYSGIQTTVEISSVPTGGAILPMVGPVTNFQVASQDAYGSLSAVGLNPTLSWAPPALGQADFYSAYVYRVYDNNGVTALEFVQSILTEDTSTVITGLEAAESYIFGVVAIQDGVVDRIATPLQSSLPEANASVASSLATP